MGLGATQWLRGYVASLPGWADRRLPAAARLEGQPTSTAQERHVERLVTVVIMFIASAVRRTFPALPRLQAGRSKTGRDATVAS